MANLLPHFLRPINSEGPIDASIKEKWIRQQYVQGSKTLVQSNPDLRETSVGMSLSRKSGFPENRGFQFMK